MGFVVNYPPATNVTVTEDGTQVTVAAAGPRGPQGDPGVVAATAPLTYDSGTQTVALDESGIEIAPSQVTGTAVVDNDSRLSDARTPTAHATSHEAGGSDELTLAQSQVTDLTTDLAAKASLASPTFTGTVEAADIEVSGGVFLGGTAAANELDDYEEGTWTPTYEPETGAFGTITYDSVTGGKYIKIGNVVHYWLRLRTDAITIGTASGDLFVGGLPFTVPSGSQAQFAASGAAEVSTWAGDAPFAALAITGTTRLRLDYRSSANGDSFLCNPADLGTGANANALLVAGTYWLA